MSQPGWPVIGFKNPAVFAPTNLASGDVHTGEWQHVRGGGRAATFGSGMVAPSVAAAPGAVAVGPDVLIFSGAGRLNSILPHTQLVSGISVFFYDSAIPVSGGPFIASGHKIIGVLPQSWSPAVQGSGAVSQYNPQPINVDFPFTSGLAFNSRSGQPGFSISWTPEVSVSFPNP